MSGDGATGQTSHPAAKGIRIKKTDRQKRK